MTAKEKANELVRKFIKQSRADDDIKPIDSAKVCALICVGEILKNSEIVPIYVYDKFDKYWQEVKQEIEKL